MKPNVWIVDDDRSIRWVMQKALERADMNVRSFENADALLASLKRQHPDTIISDIRMPGMDGLQLLEKIHSETPQMPVIITTAHSDLDSAVAAYQGGAFEYLPKPFDIDDLVSVTRRALTVSREKASQSAEQSTRVKTEIIGEAPAMQEVFRAIGRLSQSHITVLINGESGTGKELVAHALHKHSPRQEQPFIALNMAAIPHDLI
ncbi:MAG: response regulator, partial [Burkholderiaceae bacterium]